MKKYSLEKLELINSRKVYFENEEKRAKEKPNAEGLRAQEKHEWGRTHYKLMCNTLRHKVMDLKQLIIGNIFSTILDACVVGWSDFITFFYFKF